MDGNITSVVLFISITFVLYLIVSTRHKERMALIERGMDLGLLLPTKDHALWRKWVVAFGCLAVGISIGIVAGIIFSNVYYDAFHTYRKIQEGTNFHTHFSDNSEAIITPLAFLFGGLGLIVSVFIDRLFSRKD